MTYNIVRRLSINVSRIFSLILLSMLLCSAVLFPLMVQNVRASPGIGYWIITAGTYYGSLQTQIDYGCNEVFRILLRLGYSKARIYYLNPSFQDVDNDSIDDRDNSSSDTNLQYAIQTWASSRVSSTESLFLYLFDHGGSEVFCIQNATGDFSVSSTELDSWLDSLPANVPKHVIYAACHSGSFINELSTSGRETVCSCRGDQSSYVSADGKWEAFSQPFWNQIQSGHSVNRSFNRACKNVEDQGFPQDPLLDDDGDGTGHTDPLPNGGDGYVAAGVYIGSRWSWVFPFIRYLISVITFQWSPTSPVTLWAKVENATPLAHVRAWMQPPGWSAPTGNNELVPMGLEYFEMMDPDHDGNFTVDIPAINFTKYSIGLFKFIVTAEETDGDTAIPLITGVEFTLTGEPPLDNTNPTVHIERPIEDRVVSGTIKINGTATDDVCLDRVELYINGDYKQTIYLPPTSNSFFEFSFDTTTVSNGPITIMVKAFDTTGNWGTQTISVRVGVGVGGVWVPVDKLVLLGPYIALVSTILVATAATAIYVKRVKHRKKKQ